MRRKPSYVRDAVDFQPGIVAPWPVGHDPVDKVAQDVHYLPSGEHKNHPSPKGLWTFGPRKGKALCDTFDEKQWPLLLQALRELLIPQEVVLNAINSESDPDEFDRQVDKFASDFRVSTQAVHWQFQNGVKGN